MKSFFDSLPQTPNMQYFTWDQGDKLQGWVAQQNAISGSSVAVVSHSWGADTAASRIADGMSVSTLITIDPVSRTDPPSMKNVQNNSGTWINVYANSTNPGFLNLGNVAAHIGGKWENDPQGYATNNYMVDMNHANVSTVLPRRW